MSPIFEKWKELAHDYAAVPGREKWDEYTTFIYTHECDLIREVEALEQQLESGRYRQKGGVWYYEDPTYYIGNVRGRGMTRDAAYRHWLALTR